MIPGRRSMWSLAVIVALCVDWTVGDHRDEMTKSCLSCIAYGTSKWSKNPPCGRHCGPFQIREDYWIDAGRPGGGSDYKRCARDLTCAEDTLIAYMNTFIRDCNGDGKITCDDYARMHRTGAPDCRDPGVDTTNYWKQYQNCMRGEASKLDARDV